MGRREGQAYGAPRPGLDVTEQAHVGMESANPVGGATDAAPRRPDQSRARDAGLLDAAPDAMVAIGLDGRIVLVNAQTERLFGYTRDELLGQEIEVLLVPTVRARHRRHRARYFADPIPRPMGVDLQLSAMRRDATEFPAEISLSAITTTDGMLVIAAVRDITDRLAADAERQRLAAEAEREGYERQVGTSRRLESLGQLAGGVAHDFNNLLGVILNYASFIADEIDELAEGESDRWDGIRNDVGEIRIAAERATQLTRQLLAFARREVVQTAVLDLNEVVTDMERLLRRSLGEHIDLVTRLTPELWPVVADSGQLEQVLLNLAVNARDAMRAAGELVIETDNVQVDADYAARRPTLTPGRYTRMRVSDTGGGMTREVRERAFEPFFTTKASGEGTGLGLATVYGIVKQSDGDVDIYSEAGLGTTISVLLPATADATPLRGGPAEARSRGGGDTILVVEDEDAMRELTRRILVRNGYTVLIAARGQEAIAISQDHPGAIDLLLTDVVMPQMLGQEVASSITMLRPSVRVLFMSGYAQSLLSSRMTLEPDVALLEKPFTEARLLAKIRELLDVAEESR